LSIQFILENHEKNEKKPNTNRKNPFGKRRPEDRSFFIISRGGGGGGSRYWIKKPKKQEAGGVSLEF